MPAKQERYRKRKADQGFQRVELLVPEELVSHLKAYARALRDAHALGLAAPLFDGMRALSQSPEQEPPPASAPMGDGDRSRLIPPAQLKADVSDRERQQRARRPDFSRGLLDE